LSTTVSAAGRCLVCGRHLDTEWTSAIDVEYGSTTDRFRYLYCGDCEALSIDPVPSDRLTEIYPPTYYSFASGKSVLEADRNPVTRVKARLDARTFRRALRHVDTRRGLAILDVGGGTGDIAAGLVRAAGQGTSATVVDIDPESIEVARSRGLAGFAGRFEDFETDERFDLILMLNLIEHVADPVGMLRRAGELLSSGGVVWVQTPNFRSLDARLFRRRNWTGLHCPRHWVVFSKRGLGDAFEAAGLEPVLVEHSQGGSFWATSILALLRRRPLEGDGLPNPLIRHPAFMPLAAVGAAFDLLTRPVRSTSQLVAFGRAKQASTYPPDP
jgi:SAM-dependent methyltransferase